MRRSSSNCFLLISKFSRRLIFVRSFSVSVLFSTKKSYSSVAILSLLIINNFLSSGSYFIHKISVSSSDLFCSMRLRAPWLVLSKCYILAQKYLLRFGSKFYRVECFSYSNQFLFLILIIYYDIYILQQTQILSSFRQNKFLRTNYNQ